MAKRSPFIEQTAAALLQNSLDSADEDQFQRRVPHTDAQRVARAITMARALDAGLDDAVPAEAPPVPKAPTAPPAPKLEKK